MRIHPRKATWSAVLGVFGAATLLYAAPVALAEPGLPAPPPVPTQAAPLPAEQAAPLPADQASPLAISAEVPHLPSPENLPPGASEVPVGPSQGHGLSYLRELWHAVQTQEVSGSGALLLLTQRPMNPDTAPPVGVPAGPAGAMPVTDMPVAPGSAVPVQTEPAAPLP